MHPIRQGFLHYCPRHARAWYPGGPVFAPHWYSLAAHSFVWAWRLARAYPQGVQIDDTACDVCEQEAMIISESAPESSPELPSLGHCQVCGHNRYEPVRDYPAWMGCHCAVPIYKVPAPPVIPIKPDDYYE